MPQRHVVYVGPFTFPWGEAASRRVAGIAASMARGGSDVTVIPGRGKTGELPLPAGHAGTVAILPGGDEVPDGRVARAWNWVAGMGRATRHTLADLRPPSHVIVYGGSFPYLLNMQRWCRQRGIPLLLDMVEWYDPSALPGGARGPVALGDQFARVQMHPKAEGVIAISSLLRDHYADMGLPVALVPPTVLEVQPRSEVPPANALRLGYAGTPGKKDELGLMLRAFDEAGRGDSNKKMEFLIAGPSEADVRAAYGASALPSGVRVLGRLGQQEIPEFVKSLHYSVLMREQKLSSNAGFPTKFVESYSAGVPVIANLTSDLGEYLVDGQSGFVADPTVTSLARSFRRAVTQPDADYAAMAREAKSVGTRFHYERYIDPLTRLLDATEPTS